MDGTACEASVDYHVSAVGAGRIALARQLQQMEHHHAKFSLLLTTR